MLVLILGQQKESDKYLKFHLVMCIAHEPWAHVTFFFCYHITLYRAKHFPKIIIVCFGGGDFFSLKNVSLSLSLSLNEMGII